MTYSLIDLTNIFVYKSLPDNLKSRVIKLPTKVAVEFPTPTGFPTVDSQIKKDFLYSLRWQEMPERNLTQCSLVDEFTALVHRYGYKRASFYARKLGIQSVLNFNATIKTLTGKSPKEFIIRYTMQMVRDLMDRTDLYKKEIAEQLHFSSPYSFSQFLEVYNTRY